MLKKTTWSRRHFLQSTAATVGAITFGALAPLKTEAEDRSVIAGAIRWDAWYKKSGNSLFAQATLAPEKYHHRAPAHCKVTPADVVSCEGNQGVMDAEIKFAVSGGLKYWAFVWYAKNSDFRTAWDLYQSSNQKKKLNWCGIVTLDLLGSLPFKNGNWQANIDEWARYMQQAEYQKVTVDQTENRPLLYILWDANHLKWYFQDDLANVAIAFAQLRQKVIEAGLGSPYIVILDGTAGADIAQKTGADAISNYISGFKQEANGTFAQLEKQVQNYWDALESTNIPIVPIAMVGWDTRPRQERPVPWLHRAPVAHPVNYYAIATPSELAQHLSTAVDHINSHPKLCPSKALLIYSWNECDEGGGIIPTLGDPNGVYLSAIAPVISSQ